MRAIGGVVGQLTSLALEGKPFDVIVQELRETMRRTLQSVFDERAENELRERLLRAQNAERLRKRALKDNRLDDASDEVIARRIKTYEEESRPLLAHYPQEIICPIDAQQPPAVVISAILSRVITLPVWRKVNDYDG